MMGVEYTCVSDKKPSLEGVQILIITSKVIVDQELLLTAPELRLVITTTSGFDHIDLVAAKRHGVAVCRSPLARRDAVVEASVAMALGLFRSHGALHGLSSQGVWGRGSLPSQNIRLIRGSTVGIVGMGVIGKSARDTWRALGATVIWSDPALDDGVSIDKLLKSSDIVTLHCSLTASSRRLIDNSSLALMRRGAILINTARGACVDLEALAHADHLGGVGLDVFPTEPPHQLAELSMIKNSVITPHSAGFHTGLGASVAAEVVETVRCWISNIPLPNPVLI